MATEKDVLIRLGAKMAPGFDRALNFAHGSFKKLGKVADTIFSLKGLAASYGVYKVIDTVKGVGNAAEEMDNLRKKTGIAVETLSRLKYAAETSGGSLDELNTGFKFLGLAVDEANRGNQQSANLFRQLGVQTKDAGGQTRNLEQIFIETANAITKETDTTRRMTLAKEAFGKVGYELIPIIGEIGNKMKEADRYAQIWTSDTIASGKALDDAFKKTEQLWEKAKTKFVLNTARGWLEWAATGDEKMDPTVRLQRQWQLKEQEDAKRLWAAEQQSAIVGKGGPLGHQIRMMQAAFAPTTEAKISVYLDGDAERFLTVTKVKTEKDAQLAKTLYEGAAGGGR